MIERTLISLFSLFACLSVSAQYKVTGKVIDAKDRQPLPGATAVLTPVGGGTPQGQSTDIDGNFAIVKMAPGNYDLKINFMGYKTYEKKITIEDSDIKSGTIRLKPENKVLDEVNAVGTLVRQEQKGDTTVFNADAFKVNPDATTEDLIKKMPGMQVDANGKVTHGGETVQKVLVDGKEFFGSDASIALRNIDASMVSKIEVFDKQSDQSAFTGFSDGNEQRTINILTKMGIKSGRFGRVYGGYGLNNHYEGGGNMNFFHGDHRLTLIGLINNINQQNFSFDDVTGAMANGGGRGMRGMGMGNGRNGVNRTGAIGTNYSYDDDKTMRFTASYFYNYNKNNSESENNQEYFSDENSEGLRTYESESESESHNYNHRITMRMRWNINPDNTLIFNPTVSWQRYDEESSDIGIDAVDGFRNRLTSQNEEGWTQGYNLRGDLTWQHRLSIPRRTISININGSTNNSDSYGISDNLQETELPHISDPSKIKTTLITAQKTDRENRSTNIGSRLQYTEPFGEHVALQINYNPSYSSSLGDRSVSADSSNVATTMANDLDNYRFSSLLSNKKKTQYLQHRAGVGINIFVEKVFNAILGLDYQHSVLDGEQQYPLNYKTHQQFTSFMPSAEFRFQRDKSFNMRFFYRSNSSAPSVDKLQNVVDVSNIRRYSSGNPDLSESTSHSLRLMSSANNVETSRFIFMMGMYSFTRNYIANHSMIASSDSLIDNDIILPRGTEYTKPINMNGQMSLRFHVNMSSPVKWLGSNATLTLGGNLDKRPSMYNYKKVTNKTYTLSGGLSLGSSFSENIDFNIGYYGNYNIVQSTQTASNNYNYYSHTANADLTCLFVGQRFVFSNSMSHNYTHGMGKDFDNNYLMWNAGLGVKFFADRRGELKVRVNDLLDSAESTRRSILDAYVQTSTTNVLGRYTMLTFTYKFKSIGGMPTSPSTMAGPMGSLPPGMRRMHM